MSLFRNSFPLRRTLYVIKNIIQTKAITESPHIATRHDRSMHACAIHTPGLSRTHWHVHPLLSQSLYCNRHYFQKRHKASKKHSHVASKDDRDSESERFDKADNEDDSDSETDPKFEDGEDKDDDLTTSEELHPDDADMPGNFRDVNVSTTSLRVDNVLAKGLNMSRKLVDDAFLGSKLLLNHAAVKKKNILVREDDCVELILSRESGVEIFKRIRILKVEETSGGRFALVARTWRGDNTRDMKSRRPGGRDNF